MTTIQEIEKTKAHLFDIKSDIQWAFNDGYNPQGFGPSVGTSGALVSDRTPNTGNLKSRNAYEEATRFLRAADLKLAALLYNEGLKSQVPLCLNHNLTLAQSLKLIKAISWRLDQIQKLDSVLLSDLEPPFTLIYQTRMKLHTAFNESLDEHTDTQPTVKFCYICSIREIRHGQRCHTCYVYKLRHNGEERPKALDNGSRPYEEAKANQAKHGCGYGIK